ncbi:hypothetical protein [Gynuella sp.]|uniref:hypothetical protein n=1 Tax=Gynuella sp. TaxID=2969146 RepID=UPI003D1074A8
MNISNGMMDIFFGYNMRVGDVQGAKEGITQFQQLADSADTPEQRERYSNAVSKLKTEILPMLEKDLGQLGSQLGLSTDLIGHTISVDDLKGLSLGLQQDSEGKLGFFDGYQPGNYFSKNT